MISTAIQQLVNYGLDTGLILPDDEIYIRNQLLMTMQLDSFTEPEGDVCYADLESILKTLVDDAAARGVCDDSPTARDLFDTRLMGVLTPRPSIVRANFEERYETDGPQAATDWFYKFSQDTDYIRRYRIKRDVKWVTKTPYGDLDITINLSKPEKDPKAIAAAKLAPQSAYPKCQLCVENEGYAGRLNHPARENHRIIPLTINDSAWNFQYSPYVYYNAVSLWFLAKNKKQKGKTLFIDARKMGTMVTRKLRELTDEDIQRIADTYNAFVDGNLEDEKGFCAVVTTQEIAKQDYILTPGRYVGIEEQEDDGEPFEEKMSRLTSELSELFAKSHELEAEIKERLGAIGYEL